jgi:hypothetical protein
MSARLTRTAQARRQADVPGEVERSTNPEAPQAGGTHPRASAGIDVNLEAPLAGD